MKNVTPNTTITPLTTDDLSSIFGGSDDVIDPETILGQTNIVIEDIDNF